MNKAEFLQNVVLLVIIVAVILPCSITAIRIVCRVIFTAISFTGLFFERQRNKRSERYWANRSQELE